MQILREEEDEEILDVTITGHSSTSVIVRYESRKRHLTCSTMELLTELSEKLPSKKRIKVENNVITSFEK